MNKDLCTVYNDTFNDIAYVCKKKEFVSLKLKNSRERRILGTKIVGCADKTGKIVSWDELPANASFVSKIKVSELTDERLSAYNSSDNIVYIIVQERDYSNSNAVKSACIYSIENVLAPNLCLLKEEFSTKMDKYTEEDEDDYNYCFVSFNTRGNKRYKSFDSNIVFIDTNEWENSVDNRNYLIIDNTVFLSTEKPIDRNGWASGNGEIWVFDKRDGSYICASDDQGEITYYKANGETYYSDNVLMSRLYPIEYKDGESYYSNIPIDGCVVLGGYLFDTNACSYVTHNWEKVNITVSHLEVNEEGEYLLSSEDDYRLILIRRNGEFEVEGVEYDNEEDYV